MQKRSGAYKLRLTGSFCTILLLVAYLSACGGTTDPAQPTTGQPAPTPASTAPTTKVGQNKMPQDAITSLQYWTEDKMTKAISIDTLVQDSKQLKEAAANVLKNNPQFSEFQLPAQNIPDIPAMSPQDLQELLKQLAELNTSASTGSTSATVLNALKPAKAQAGYQYPLSTVGKVFFSDGKQDYVCSGAAVNSGNRSLVNTAGHCVYTDGQWMSKWVFCPMYYNGKAPYGCWSASYLYADATWMESAYTKNGTFQGNFPYDYGMAVVHPNDYGRLVDVVGGVGFLYNTGTVQQKFYDYGYPSASPYNGSSMKSCSGTGQLWDNGNEEYMMSIPCNMTPGASGGPWIIKHNGGWYLNGHNSMLESLTNPTKFYSPYYGSGWYTIYREAASA